MHTKHRSPPISLFLIAACCLALLTLTPEAGAQRDFEPEALWMDVSLGPPLIELYNYRAQRGDIARIEHISQLDLLQEVSRGRKLVVFKSAEDAIRLLPHIHKQLDIVGYNLESGPSNPRYEQENPVESIRRLRAAADRYDLQVALGPDRRFAESHGVEMAPYADLFILQVQKVQTEPQTVLEFVRPLVDDIRAANPDIEISIQIRTEGDVDALLDLLATLQDDLDGVSILTSVETVSIADELLQALRPNAMPPTPTPAVGEDRLPVVEGDGGRGLAATLGEDDASVADQIASGNGTFRSARGGANQTALQDALPGAERTSTSEMQQRNASTWLFVLIGLALMLVVGAGYASQRASGPS